MMFKVVFLGDRVNWTNFEFALDGGMWTILGLNVLDDVWVAHYENYSNMPTPSHPRKFTDDELMQIWATQAQAHIDELEVRLTAQEATNEQ